MADFNNELVVHSLEPYFASNYIPASTVQVHASNLLRLPSGDLLCAWFGGSQEGISDICIYLSRLRKGARTWTEPLKITDDCNRSEQNPVLFLHPTHQEIWLMHTAQEVGNQDKAIVRQRISKDEGNTWSEAKDLFSDLGLFIRQPMIILEDSTWVLPGWYCRAPPGYRWVGSDDIPVIKYTKDAGLTWQEKQMPESIGAVHMDIKKLPDSTYIAFFRSRWADNIYTSHSRDGINWEKATPTCLPNPNSGICCEILSDNRLIIVYNDSRYEQGQAKREGLYDDITPEDDKRVNQPTKTKEAVWGVPRKTLTVGISKDGGKSWKTKVLQEGSGMCMTNNSKTKENRELSYPSIWIDRVETGNQVREVANVAFTFWRQRIKFCRFDVEWIDV